MIPYLKKLPVTYIKLPDFDLEKHGYKQPFLIEEKADGEWVVWRRGEMYGRRPDSLGKFVNKWIGLPNHFQRELTGRYDKFVVSADDHETIAGREGWSTRWESGGGWIVGELCVNDGTSSDVKMEIKQGDPDGRLKVVCYGLPSAELDPFQVRIELCAIGLPTPRAVEAPFFVGTRWEVIGNGVDWHTSTAARKFGVGEKEVTAEMRRVGKAMNFGNAYSNRSIKPISSDQLIEHAVERNWEGIVLWPDRKNSLPLRRKVVNTFDVVITGIEMAGAGKFSGMVGAVECGWFTKDLRDASKPLLAALNTLLGTSDLVDIGKVGMGFKTEERRALSEADIGRVIEVQCRGFASKGKMRHASFQRFRDDKTPQECIAPDWWWDSFKDLIEEKEVDTENKSVV